MKATAWMVAPPLLALAGPAAWAQVPGTIADFGGGSTDTDFNFRWTVPPGATQYDVRWSYIPFDSGTCEDDSTSWGTSPEADCPVPPPEEEGTIQDFCATFCEVHCHAEVPVYWAIRAQAPDGSWGELSPTIVLALHEKDKGDDSKGPCGGSSAGSGTVALVILLLAQTPPFLRSRRG